MAYGDLPAGAPHKPNKGLEGGACNRERCQAEPALWYNHGSFKWYCADCARDIGQDHVNLRDWNLRWRPKCGHDQFETREMIMEREAKETVPELDWTQAEARALAYLGEPKDEPGEYRDGRIRGQKAHSASLERMLGRRPRRGTR